jgi:ABC-type antimicrobial peptide transport system permease subunit
MNYIKEETVIAFDSRSFVEDVNERMVMLDIMNSVISLICFILGLFQLIVTISANIRDSMWELGVLRAMGMTKQ